MHGEFRSFKNGLKPVAELAADKPHGNRIRYMAGCRCVPCRAANSRYESERVAARKRGEWNGCVPADKARQHLIMLSERGIGRDTVADIVGMAPSVIDRIRKGKAKSLRAMNEKKILAIDPDSVLHAAQLISAKKTWQQIRHLLKLGFTEADLAKRLGYKSPVLQFNRYTVTARNAMKVERLYNQVCPTAGTGEDGPRLRELQISENLYVDLCTKCPLPDCIDTSPKCLIQITRRAAA